MDHRLRRYALSALLVLGAAAAAQEPPPATNPGAGALAPETSHLWLRLNKVDDFLGRLDDHPLELAWQTLRKTNSPLSRAIEAIERGTRSFAAGHGLATDVLLHILGSDTRLSVFDRGGQPDFLMLASLGEHLPVVQNVIDGLPEIEGHRGGHWYQLPHAHGARFAVALVAGRLAVAGTPESLTTARQLLAGKAKSLGTQSSFVACGLAATSDQTFLSVYVRPQEALAALEPAETNALAKLIVASGWADLKAVSWTARHGEKDIEERVHALLPGAAGYPMDFVGDGKPDVKLARLIPAACRHWFAARIAPRGLIALLKRSRVSVPGLGRVGPAIDALTASQAVDGLDDLASIIGNDALIVATTGTTPVRGIVLTLKDSFRARNLLGKLGKRIEVPLGADQGIFRFKLEHDGQSVEVALCDDYVLVSPTDEQIAVMLEQFLSGKANPAVEKRFFEARPGEWLLGQENPRVRLPAADPSGERALAALAQHFDEARIDARREGRMLTLTARGMTGTLHLPILAVDRVLPDLIDHRRTAIEITIVDLADHLRRAQRSYMKLALTDRDEDHKGEAGDITDLVKAGLFAPAAGATLNARGRLDAQGYRFTILKPLVSDDAEGDCAVLAWPQQPGFSGEECFFVRLDGTTHAHPWVADLDVDAGPVPSKIFAGDAFDSPLLPVWDERRSTTRSGPTTANGENTPAVHTRPATPSRSLSAADIARAQLRLDKARDANDRAALRGFLEHADPRIQARAAHYLGDLKDRESVPALANLLRESKNVVVRRRAARALSLIRDAKSSATLVDVLDDADAKVRLFAATGLLGTRAHGAITALVALVDTNAEDEAGERTQAILALHDMGDAAVLKRLVGVADGGPRFQQALTYCFQELSPKLDASQETELLVQTLASPCQPLRAYAMQRIAAAGYTEALAPLTSRLEVESPALQAQLRLAIESLTPKRARTIGDRLAGVLHSLKRGYWRLRRQPKWIQTLLALTPLALLALLVMWRVSRQRALRLQSAEQMSEFVQPSDTYEAVVPDDELGADEIDTPVLADSDAHSDSF